MKTLFFGLLLISTTPISAKSLPKDKNLGIAVNPFYLFVVTPSGKGEQYLSATISHFNHNKKVEIAMPLHRMRLGSFQQKTLDLHYRKYLRSSISGPYISGFTRFAKLERNSESEFKVGFGAGVGFKLFHSSGAYWGASLNGGIYPKASQKFTTSDLFVITDNNRFIFDVELFKFGYAF